MSIESFSQQSESVEQPDLTLETINAAMEAGKPLQVKVLRSSGELEEGWEAIVVDPATQRVSVMKKVAPGETAPRKAVKLTDLQEWNR